MDFPAKRKYILGKLRENVRIGVEYEGYESGMSPGDYYDTQRSIGNVPSFNRVMEKAKGFQSQQPEMSQSMIGGLTEIDSMLSKYADFLAKNAEIGNVDVANVKDEVFQKQARIFENKFRDKLVVTSPDFFI